jgi:hypothetical protein
MVLRVSGQRVRIGVLDGAQRLLLSRKADNTSVAPMPRSLAIRIEGNDIEVLYALVQVLTPVQVQCLPAGAKAESNEQEF